MTATVLGRPRVADRLNAALHRLLTEYPASLLLGEDIVDPYGGAFRITKGLSTDFPGRVRAMPLSEGAIAGVANGLALSGDPVVVEIMFGDFVTLAFDQLVNFAANSVTMYGQRVSVPVVVRAPVGARRGYGPTHSQSPQKYFLGVANLRLAELTPFHDPWEVLASLVRAGEPALHFEDKVLYTQRAYLDGIVDDVFRYDLPDGPTGYARIHAGDPRSCDAVIVCPGGMAHRALSAARDLLLEHEIVVQVLVPAMLYPLDVRAVLEAARDARLVCVAEDGGPGGSWAELVALRVHREAWGRLTRPVEIVAPPPSVIPTAPHLEQAVTVGADTIARAVRAGLHA